MRSHKGGFCERRLPEPLPHTCRLAACVLLACVACVHELAGLLLVSSSQLAGLRGLLVAASASWLPPSRTEAGHQVAQLAHLRVARQVAHEEARLGGRVRRREGCERADAARRRACGGPSSTRGRRGCGWPYGCSATGGRGGGERGRRSRERERRECDRDRVRVRRDRCLCFRFRSGLRERERERERLSS